MLLANNISFKRGSKVIFQKINLTLSPKKIIYLTGKNGSGKTTLLKVLEQKMKPLKVVRVPVYD